MKTPRDKMIHLSTEVWDGVEKYVRENLHLPLRPTHVARALKIDVDTLRWNCYVKNRKYFPTWVDVLRVEKATPMLMMTDPETGKPYTTARVMNLCGIRGSFTGRSFLRTVQKKVDDEWTSQGRSTAGKRSFVKAVVRGELKYLLSECSCPHCEKLVELMSAKRQEELRQEKMRTRQWLKRSKRNTSSPKPEKT